MTTRAMDVRRWSREEVHRDPVEGAYRERTVLRAGNRVAPLARPEVEISVSDLLP